MKKFLLSLFLVCGIAQADTTPNLIGGTWNNVTVGSHPNNCCTGGPGPLYDPNTGIIHFSYGLTAVHQVIAINQALSGTGIQISGWNWGYDLRNMNGSGGQSGTDTINVTSFMTDSNGQIIQQSDQYYNTQFDWTRFTGTVNLSSARSLESSGSLGIQFVSRDTGFWAGYYGPQVRNVSLNANYSVDQCAADPLSSTSCPGYEAAYLSMQCSANPLYSSSCPGYAAAYYTQQCSINPLYDSGCPNYQQAYYAQQCSLDPLYDVGCPGYETAYFNQQCSLNSLYNSACPGYEAAYFTQQCELDGLYSNQCPNYAEAYAKKNLLDSSSTAQTGTASTTEPTVQVSSDGSVSTGVQVVGDSNVNKVITQTATSAAPSATSAVQLAPEQNTAQGESNANSETESESSKETQTASTSNSSNSNKTSRRQQAARSQSQERAEAAAKEGLKAAENATTIEAQVAVQANILAAMGYVPGFAAYQSTTVVDVLSAQVNRQYGKPVTDNARALRQLSGASDRMHSEMINEQYR